MSDETGHDDRRPWADGPRPVSPLGHKVMFVGLTCVAFGLFAPTVVLPILHEYCALLAEESRLSERVAELDWEIQHQGELASAFAHDVVINERLAVLDLHYRKPGEVILPVLPRACCAANRQSVEEPITRGTLVLPSDWPGWAHEAKDWADERGLIALFVNTSLRPVFLLMSAGLLIAAFVLFAPSVHRRDRTAQRAAPTDEPTLTQPAA